MKNSWICIALLSLLFACGAASESSEENTADSTRQAEENPQMTEEEIEADITRKMEKSETPENQQSVSGMFTGIEQGDYFYFTIKTEAGEDMSFMVLQTDATFEAISENPEKYTNAMVKVYWETTTENIPEAGGDIEINKYIKAEIL